MSHRISIALFTVLLAACNSTITDSLDDIEQRYLFEIEYVNHAWGLSWQGLVVDREGNIYAYDHSHDIWEHAGAETFTEQQLSDKYQHESRYVARIDKATMVEKYGRISEVSNQLSAPQYPCADAGGLTYTAFRFSPESSRYVPLLLRQEGDLTRENNSGAGEDLAIWLRNLISALEDPGVSPFNEGVCTP